MKKIDLSFLKHKELPTKTITVKIADKEQEFDIKPVTGRGLTSLGLISEDDLDRNSKMCLLALMYGLNIKQEDAEAFMNEELIAADTIAAEVLQFTTDYQTELSNAKTQIKKNTKNKTKQLTQDTN